MKYFLDPTQGNSDLNQMHFIIAGDSNAFEIEKGIQKALKEFGRSSAILSLIKMYKENCITKEKYEQMYKTNEKSETRMDLSVAEDLETFIEKLKNGKINIDTIPEDGVRNETFLLCLLYEEERKKLEQKDQAFMVTFGYGSRADVPEAEWKASESKLKFARYICKRSTYLNDA